VDEQVVIIGAGPAGLAAAWAIRHAGIDPLVLERAAVAAAWRSRHDQLRLNTHRMFSHQPGSRIARRCGPYPARDDYIAYLEQYADGMRIRLGTAAVRVDRAGRGWELDLGGRSISTVHVVVASGPDAEPVMPIWPGMASFTGQLMHSGQFRSTSEMAGLDVLVVGPGNSGVDLLNHLVRSEAGTLWLSARSGMNLAPQRLAGIPLHPVSLAFRRLPLRAQDATLRVIQRVAFGNLAEYGYPRSELGAFTRIEADGVTVAVDDGFVRGLKAGRVTMKPSVDRLDGSTVWFADGSACAPDVVICATGYRADLSSLVGHLVRLDEHGLPPYTGPVASHEHPGLWFFGLDRSIYGHMHVHRPQARQLARMIARAP
jgi:putative flavoprotein involved in K+ transport